MRPIRTAGKVVGSPAGTEAAPVREGAVDVLEEAGCVAVLPVRRANAARHAGTQRVDLRSEPDCGRLESAANRHVLRCNSGAERICERTRQQTAS